LSPVRESIAPLVTVGELLATPSKKNWEMMVNPDEDGYSITLNHQKYFENEY